MHIRAKIINQPCLWTTKCMRTFLTVGYDWILPTPLHPMPIGPQLINTKHAKTPHASQSSCLFLFVPACPQTTNTPTQGLFIGYNNLIPTPIPTISFARLKTFDYNQSWKWMFKLKKRGVYLGTKLLEVRHT